VVAVKLALVWGMPYTGLPNAVWYASIADKVGTTAAGILGPLFLWTAAKSLSGKWSMFPRAVAVGWALLTTFVVAQMVYRAVPF
jgi:hypothetical protein